VKRGHDRSEPLFSTQTPKEQTAAATLAIKSDQRGIDREVTRLKREEQKCEAAIKAAARKPGGEVNARTLARSLVQIREQIARLTKTSASIGSVATSITVAGTTATVAGSMASATKVMGAVNKQIEQANVGKTMEQFAMQSDAMKLKEEMLDDAFEALDDGDWEAEDETLAMVMDELGLEVSSQMNAAPTTGNAAASARCSRSQGEAALAIAAAA